jgi:endonuclease YncB( thermonuclease family)
MPRWSARASLGGTRNMTAPQFTAAAADAREHRRGLWADPNLVPRGSGGARNALRRGLLADATRQDEKGSRR